MTVILSNSEEILRTSRETRPYMGAASRRRRSSFNLVVGSGHGAVAAVVGMLVVVVVVFVVLGVAAAAAEGRKRGRLWQVFMACHLLDPLRLSLSYGRLQQRKLCISLWASNFSLPLRLTARCV